MKEKELVQLSKEGNEEAFGVLVEEYRIKVFNLAFSMTYNREVANDLSQEVFIKTYYALPKFKFQSEFSTWLYRITVNHIKDYLRKEGRMKKIFFEKNIENLLPQEDEIMKREKEQTEKRRRNLVRNAIRTLPEKYKIILSLRDIRGLSYGEISKILKIPPGSVDSRLHRARKLLRKRISPFLLQKGGNDEV